MSVSVILLACAATESRTFAQCPAWTEVTGQSLQPTFSPAVATDYAHGVVYAFGGNDDHLIFSSAFLRFQDDAWYDIPGNRPPARANSAMVYDEARDRLVLFGGRTSPGTLDSDLWEWDGTSWQQMIATGPVARLDHAMVYDAERRCSLLYGGLGQDGGLLADFWSWDGTQWTQLPATPGPRWDQAMAFNERDRHVYFHGGTSGVLRRDLWSWDGANWQLVSLSGPLRGSHGMIYDPHRAALVITGGADTTTLRGETFVWDGQWHTLAATLPPRIEFGMGYHEPTQKAVTIGGGTGPNWIDPSNQSFALRSGAFRVTSPSDQTLPPERTATFCAQIDSPATVTYQWRKNGTSLSADSRITGVTTNCLSIALISSADAGAYDVRISSNCDPVYSLPARLSVFVAGDLNCDGFLNNFDIDPFVLALTNPAGYAIQFPNCDINVADINADGAVNNFDIDPFVNCLVHSGCP